jgi:proline dehydrogenase
MPLSEVDTADPIAVQYSAHEPLPEAGTSRRWKNFSARTYFYQNEATCERNAETFLRCIEAVAGQCILYFSYPAMSIYFK